MARTGKRSTGRPSAAPTRKVTSAALAGALSAILVYIFNHYVAGPDDQLPAEIASAITTLLSFLVAYFIPPGDDESVLPAG